MLLLFFVSTGPLAINEDKTASPAIDLNSLSENFLIAIKNNVDTNDIRAKLYGITLASLKEGLKTNQQKLAFWINIYNGYIQIMLSENPNLYRNRGEFFKREQIPIAGRLLSFEKIEHGLIRKSQWPFGLGLVRKWCPDKFERKLRVDQRDYRIHFALNCGAKDCPPIAIYKPVRLDTQLNERTKKYLERTSKYSEKDKVTITSLFNWFRCDFGGKNGHKRILK